eukprot:scaffold33548_cov130-Skeletonema_dohrnii-CCMP3373.AAC.5
MSSTHASDLPIGLQLKRTHILYSRGDYPRESLSRQELKASSRLGQTEDSSAGDTISHVTPEPEQLFEATTNPNSYYSNLSADIADMLNRIDATLQHHRDQYQGIVLFAKDASYHVNQSETHMNDVRSDSIENAVETAGVIDQLANAKAKKKNKQKKKKKEAENNNNRQALKSQRKRIATSILALLLLIVLILLGLLFAFGTS